MIYGYYSQEEGNGAYTDRSLEMWAIRVDEFEPDTWVTVSVCATLEKTKRGYQCWGHIWTDSDNAVYGCESLWDKKLNIGERMHDAGEDFDLTDYFHTRRNLNEFQARFDANSDIEARNIAAGYLEQVAEKFATTKYTHDYYKPNGWIRHIAVNGGEFISDELREHMKVSLEEVREYELRFAS